ncbi:MAG: hypothetical protein ACJATS_002317, partial [Psychroserpens sp.]
VAIELYDMKGSLVTTVDSEKLGIGLHYLNVEASNLMKGTYLMKMTVGENIFTRTVIKA